MILVLAAFAAAAGPAAPSPALRYKECVALADAQPAKAIAQARAWAGSGGGVPAGQCLGLAQVSAGDWKAATETFATTADLAQQTHDGRAADLWVQAGNAALAGGDPTRAKDLLASALALPVLSDAMRGEAYLDRARADVALGAPAEARTDMDEALKRVPADPMAWLLSATLARRMNDPTRARHDIGEAATRAPDEPAILTESGNIAAVAGDMTLARREWTRARTIDPSSDAGIAAAKELAASGGTPPTPAREGR